MRDHPYHATQILGGMSGIRNGFLLGMRKAILDDTQGDF